MATPIIDSVDQDELTYAKTPWWKLLLRRKMRLKSRTPMPQDGVGEGSSMEEPARGFWSNEAESVLSLLGLAVGLGNVWRFPWMVSKNGGGVFLIPYFFMLFFCGLPLFLMEMTIGQYSGSGPANVFEAAPLFKGLGWCVLTGAIIGGTYYITVITWSFYYMFSSFTAELPWVGCNNKWNSDACFSKDDEDQCEANNTIYLSRQCVENTTTNLQAYNLSPTDKRVWPTDEFFNRKMYNIYNVSSIDEQVPISHTGYPKWDITLTLLFAWIVAYLCICKGIKSSGKVVYFTALFPYVAITGLLIVAAQLDGASDGVSYYIRPPENITQLTDFRIWVDATTQIFYSLGLSGGSVMTYSSYNRYNNNILRDCLIVGLGNSFTSFFAGFPVFCVLGYMAKRLKVTIDDVVKSGSALVFIVYPEVLAKLPGAQFWCFVFFLMLITLGLDSQFGSLETLLTAVLDKRPKLLPKKPIVALVICSTMFLLGLSTVTQAGVYWEEVLNYYSGFATVFLAMINSVVYSWVYGAGNLIDHLQHMINKKFPVTLVWTLLFLWKVVAPVIISIILITNFIYVDDFQYHGYSFPVWAQVIGWMTAIVPLVLVPIAAVYTYMTDLRTNPFTAETMWQRLRRLTKPTDKWMPSYKKYKQEIINPDLPESPSGLANSNKAASNGSYGSSDDVISTPDITATGQV